VTGYRTEKPRKTAKEIIDGIKEDLINTDVNMQQTMDYIYDRRE